MTIEIRELVIEARVTEKKTNSARNAPQASVRTTQIEESLMDEIVSRVLNELREKIEGF